MYGIYRGAPQSINRQVYRQDKVIVVNGYAQKLQQHDRAVIVFDVINIGEDPVRAISNNKKAVENKIRDIKETGIRDEDIFYNTKNVEEINIDGARRYKSSTVFQIIQYNLADLSELLYNLRSDSTEVKDVVFTSGNNKEVWNETFQEAIANAYKRALAAAEELNVKIDPVPLDLKDVTDTDAISKGIQQSLIKDYASLSDSGLVNIYTIVVARYLIIKELE